MGLEPTVDRLKADCITYYATCLFMGGLDLNLIRWIMTHYVTNYTNPPTNDKTTCTSSVPIFTVACQSFSGDLSIRGTIKEYRCKNYNDSPAADSSTTTLSTLLQSPRKE